MATQTAAWHLKGTVTQACSCDYGCPCNFQAPPTYGHCEGGWTWHVAEGSYGDVWLDGLHFTVIGDWPEAIHKGNGEALLLIDERADAGQREAIQTLLSGLAGGPWGILGKTIVNVHGPYFVPYEARLDGARNINRAGEIMQLEMEAIRNPVTGAESFPGVVLPQGFVYKESTRTSTKSFVVRGDVSMESHGTDAAFSPFEYRGP